MTSIKTAMRVTEICADCGSLDPAWALVNRGLLVCDECCSVHRSLGRHISQVKSLKKSHWSPSQLAMVHALNNGGVNSLWEHSLVDSKSKRKPTPKDPVHPTKAEFIRAKHRDLEFVLRGGVGEPDEELHSSVRTANLETSLRLIVLGADPNYFHKEKGSRVLHVAARAGQLSQVELLLAHGADPRARDARGNTPAQCARGGGHREVEVRLQEVLYEVTDRLTYFACRRRPDHLAGEHLLVPEPSDCIVQPQPPSNQATARLRMLSNGLFEELAMDVYDEVDRRETESIWELSGASLELSCVPFLPVNPGLSATRNQGRQKLATCSPGEFAALVLDILYEARRRQALHENGRGGRGEDEEPLYDSVASDEDYATAEQLAILVAQNEKGLPLSVDGGAPAPLRGSMTGAEASDDRRELMSRLAASEARASQLSQHIVKLNSKVEEMCEENKMLKSALRQQQAQHEAAETEPVLDIRSPPQHQRPVSMYETREALRAQGVGSMPQCEEVVRRTTQVTKRIQELWSCMRAESLHGCVPCAERIRVAVAELTAIFPQKGGDEVTRGALRQLNTSTVRLQADCSELRQCAEQVRASAYALANANRQIVTRYNS